MARIRTIKPDFWVDEKIVELSFPARLLFIGLWNFCDDAGRMEYREKKIKMQIFPADSVDMSELFGEIRRELLVEIYTIENKEFLQIKNFDKHQKVDKRSTSKIPDKDGNLESPPEDSGNSDRKGKGKGKGREVFTPPTLAEVSAYCVERRNSVNPQRFIDFYSSKGWLVGRAKMKDWKACIRNWEQEDKPKNSVEDGAI